MFAEKYIPWHLGGLRDNKVSMGTFSPTLSQRYSHLHIDSFVEKVAIRLYPHRSGVRIQGIAGPPETAHNQSA